MKHLYVQENQLTGFPDSIGSLNNLEELEFSYNQVSKLPETIGKLTNLKEIGGGNNMLTNFPDSFGNLTNLVHLYFNENQFTSLPESIVNINPMCGFLIGNQHLLPNNALSVLNSLGMTDVAIDSQDQLEIGTSS